VILDKPLPAELEPHVSSSIMLNILGGINFDFHLPLIKMAKLMYSNCYGPDNCSHHGHYRGPYERAVRMGSWHLRLNGYACNWLTDEL
jgi:hypothetical protein